MTLRIRWSMKDVIRVVVGIQLMAFVVSAGSAQSRFSTPRHNLHESERRAYLLAARKAWIEVDDLSDARPVAACFADRLKATTPLTLVDRREDADVVLRFFTPGDFSAPSPTLGQQLFLSMLLLNNEMIWQGWITPNPTYAGPDPSCQHADALAGQLRAAMRAARDGTPTPQEQAPVVDTIQEELIWNTKDVDDRITEVNRVFVRHAWSFTVHNGSDATQVSTVKSSTWTAVGQSWTGVTSVSW